jgi:hypothetical protein
VQKRRMGRVRRHNRPLESRRLGSPNGAAIR